MFEDFENYKFMNGKFDNTETGEKYEVLILIKG